MVIQPYFKIVGAPSGPPPSSRGEHLTPLYQQMVQPQTPPSSIYGSPRVRAEGMKSDFSPEFKSLPGFIHLNTPPQNPQYKLPSLGEFDQGVEDLARVHGRTSPMIGRTVFNDWGNTTTNQALPSVWAVREHVAEEHVPNAYLPRRETNSLGQYTLAIDQARRPLQSYTSPDSSYNYPMTSPTVLAQSNMDCYPSPPPEGENRHINQKYTTEEGDYIIYAWHDKKMKWQRIKQEFATRFGCTPERTVQGLQAWYYRMNQRIPIWDQDGWLCYDNEDDVEPRHVSIKCRARDSQDKPMEPLGLAQRYPERAMNYSWVDPELKEKARDWASKRSHQYRERRERRRRKEHRRMKL